jgi:hypothetical protein
MKEEEVKMEMRETQIREEEERCLQVRHVRRMRDLEEATFKGRGLLGPMISDVRDHYVDNFRFPTL